MIYPEYEHLNLWGFDCVKLSIGRKIVRIGTDDRQGLLAFLNGKLAARIPPA